MRIYHGLDISLLLLVLFTLSTMTGTTEPFASGIAVPLRLAMGEDGSLYYLAHAEGAVYRVRPRRRRV